MLKKMNIKQEIIDNELEMLRTKYSEFTILFNYIFTLYVINKFLNYNFYLDKYYGDIYTYIHTLPVGNKIRYCTQIFDK